MPTGTAMLFLPPLQPVALPETGCVVLGRSKSCDLTLPNADASRRHATVEAEAGGYVLRDLDSTNGTFVNGQRVQEYRLRTGDRIEIGGDLVTFCEIDRVLDAGELTGSGEAQTRLMERPALGECVQGSLSEIPPFAVLQMLEMGRKTGVLEVGGGGIGLGRLWLVAGHPVHAETKDQCGFDAAISIVNVRSGRFSFEPGRATPDSTIQASVTELLLEASRHLDEDL